MKFHVLTLFPDMVENCLRTSIIGRAVDKNILEINAVDIREYSDDRHGKVDDYTYGGGAGMLMQAQPVYDAWRAVAGQAGTDQGGTSQETAGGSAADRTASRHVRTVYVTPQGMPFTQNYAMELAQEEEIIFLCGHYEGIDARALDEIVTDYVSIGDYVLTGGELPAMVMIDAIARLVPGVLHNDESAETESFRRYLLEYPQYSRPEVWRGRRVPEVLLSGNHRNINAWRLEQSKLLTKERRPDLYAKYLEQETLIGRLSKNKRHNIHLMESLSRGRGEILVNSGGNIMVYDRGSRICMISAVDMEGAGLLLEAVPRETESVVISQEFLAGMLEEQAGFHVVYECRPACYTQRNPLPVRHKDIRRLTEEHLPCLMEHYIGEDREYLAGDNTRECLAGDHAKGCREYLAGRIRAGVMYGAFAGEQLAGFMGWHGDGRLGLLYVEEAYRRRGIGSSLEAYCINRQLEQGYLPYGYIAVDDEVSLKMQEHLGLYLSGESLWWMGR